MDGLEERMNEIKCPNCGKVFSVDDTSYAAIVSQVRTKEFEQDIKRSADALQEKQRQTIELVKKDKDAQMQELKSKMEMDAARAQAERDRQISELKSKLDILQGSVANEKERAASQVKEAVAEKEKRIAELTAQMETVKAKAALDVQTRTQSNELEIQRLKSAIETKEKEFALEKTSLKNNYDKDMERKDEEIAQYKEFKARQSTKMIGESLEVYCHDEFNKARMSAYPNAYFEKDNDAQSGSKGDFIFREETSDGIEIISIMFEMKNEADTTAARHKNEDFFAKLDKDRKNKKCEYAVLVSMLEGDSELYNSGIVDVSYRYEKMFVIRPQFFMPMIALLRNAAMNALQYKRQMQEMQRQNIDITNFNQKIDNFKGGFSRNVELASKKFNAAIAEIDKSIKLLQEIKADLLSSGKHLSLACKKLDDLSVKKLTYNNPTMQKLFADADMVDDIKDDAD